MVGAVHWVEVGARCGGSRSLRGTVLVVTIISQLTGRLPGRVLHFEPLGAGVGAGGDGGRGEGLDMRRHDCRGDKTQTDNTNMGGFDRRDVRFAGIKDSQDNNLNISDIK